MGDLFFRCAQCGDYIPAGGGFANEQLVARRIIARADEQKPINVAAVVARRDYLDQLPAVEEFLRAHQEHTVIFEGLEGVPDASRSRARPPYYEPQAVTDRLMLVKAGGKYVRSDFILGRQPVTVGEFCEIVGGADGRSEVSATVKLATWAEAIRYCNLLSRKEGKPVAYDESTGNLLDAAGDRAQDVSVVKGFRLPTGAEWDYAARGGRPNPPYADWGAVLDRIYWDDPTSYGAHPVPPKESVVNVIGLVGMLGWVREWYSHIHPRQEGRNRICGWSHHLTNYDCQIAYHVAGESAAEAAVYPFRVACCCEAQGR